MRVKITTQSRQLQIEKERGKFVWMMDNNYEYATGLDMPQRDLEPLYSIISLENEDGTEYKF